MPPRNLHRYCCARVQRLGERRGDGVQRAAELAGVAVRCGLSIESAIRRVGPVIGEPEGNNAAAREAGLGETY